MDPICTSLLQMGKQTKNLTMAPHLVNSTARILTLFFFFFFCLFVFLGPHPQHMEGPRLGVQSELLPLAYATGTAIPDLSRVCNLYHSSQQRQMLNPLSKSRDRTHILRETISASQPTEQQWELLLVSSFNVAHQYLSSMYFLE